MLICLFKELPKLLHSTNLILTFKFRNFAQFLSFIRQLILAFFEVFPFTLFNKDAIRKT